MLRREQLGGVVKTELPERDHGSPQQDNTWKEATLDTGLQIQVPRFMDRGESCASRRRLGDIWNACRRSAKVDRESCSTKAKIRERGS